jgi:uridine phosphorylase
MTFPNFKNKHGNDSMFSPQEFLDYQKSIHGFDDQSVPERIIICYSRTLFKNIESQFGFTKVNFSQHIYISGKGDNTIGLAANFGIGAPTTVTLFEEMIAMGGKEFISIGDAGTLQSNLSIGDIVVCEKAIRDEGTSHHYEKAAKYAYPSEDLVNRITRVLSNEKKSFHVGVSWTIDAPYRETVAEAKHYQKEGVLTVEMEASALYTVAKYRGVKVASMFMVSDSLAELAWNPKFHETKGDLIQLFEIAKETLIAKEG